ncbi:MAG: hypothetical protein ACYCZJ_13240 [Sulfuriferula sp.]
MSKIILNENQTTGVQTFYETAEEAERFTTAQNVDDILVHAAEARHETQGERYGEFRRMAVMPMSVVGQAMREGWLFDQARVRQWVKDNPAFKTFDKNF